jgi:hypothetical protein
MVSYSCNDFGKIGKGEATGWMPAADSRILAQQAVRLPADRPGKNAMKSG